jgi:dihydropteroate synthase
VVAKLLPKTDPVHKVTIIPRGRALGVTMQLPVEDRYSMDRDRLLSTIAVLFGGRIAEEIFMHQMTTGASNNFEPATEMARRMVTQWGMSDALGPMVYGENEGEVFLGRSITTHKNVSEVTMQKVDQEIRRIIDEQYALARRLIEENSDKVEAMAKALLEWETLDSDQLNDIMEGKAPREPKPKQSGTTPPPLPQRRRATIAARTRRPPGKAVNSGGRSRSTRAPGARGCLRSESDDRALQCARFRLVSRSTVDHGRGQHHAGFLFKRRQVSIPPAGVAHARQLIEEGAAISLTSAPSPAGQGAAALVGAEEELRRLLPVLRGLRDVPVPVSVDTSKPEVMRAALAEGASMINDINALRAPGAVAAVAAADAAVCLMHMQGTPGTMQQHPSYADVVAEVKAFLLERVRAARAAGIALERIAIDPGFGFGKTLEHNLELLRHLREFEVLGVPLLAGWSRKSSLGKITGKPAGERLAASVAAALIAVQHGAGILRVHDVAATRDALAVLAAVENTWRPFQNYRNRP